MRNDNSSGIIGVSYIKKWDTWRVDVTVDGKRHYYGQFKNKEDAILVSNKSDTNGIKNIYKKLNGANSSKKEIHKTVYRPWGYYTVLEHGNGFLTKCITVNPNAKLSVQLHHHRSEHWIILEGKATVIKGDETIVLESGESIDIAAQEIHSLQNLEKEQLKVLEVQQGEILDENDIERIQDIYGRV